MLEYRVLPTDGLIIDGTYQRYLSRSSEQRIAKIGKDWRWDLVGAIHVNHRGNDTFAVIDGQHRVLGARIATVPQLPCLIHEGLSPFQEAKLFVDLNVGQVKLRAADRFRAALFGGDPVATGVTNVVMDAGLHISLNKSGDLTHLDNVGTLVFVYEQTGSAVTRRALEVIKAAWPHDEDRWHRYLLSGVAGFIYLYQSHPDFRDERFSRSLSLLPPRDILNRIRAMGTESLGTRVSTDTSLRSTMRLIRPSSRRIFLDQYNYRLRTNMLPDLTYGEVVALVRNGKAPW